MRGWSATSGPHLTLLVTDCWGDNPTEVGGEGQLRLWPHAGPSVAGCSSVCQAGWSWLLLGLRMFSRPLLSQIAWKGAMSSSLSSSLSQIISCYDGNLSGLFLLTIVSLWWSLSNEPLKCSHLLLGPSCRFSFLAGLGAPSLEEGVYLPSRSPQRHLSHPFKSYLGWNQLCYLLSSEVPRHVSPWVGTGL